MVSFFFDPLNRSGVSGWIMLQEAIDMHKF